MANNKVVLADGTALIDLTDSTISADTVRAGYIGYDKAGVKITGAYTPGSVPSEYQVVNYVQSDSRNAYIDTGLYLDGTYDIECEGCTGSYNAGILFDAFESSNKRIGGIFYNRANPRYDRFWTGVSYAQQATPGIDLGSKFYIRQDQGGSFIRQSSTVSSIAYTGTFETSSTAKLLLFSSARTDYEPDKSVLYWCKVCRNGEVLRDFVPVMRLSDSTAGMYDRVTESFFGTAGSQALVYG